MGLATATLKKGEGRFMKAGGLWIYDNEIDTVMGSFEDGDVVLVRDFDGYPLGRGFINRHSKIRIRMLTRDIDQEIDDDFLRARVKNAWEYRKTVLRKENEDPYKLPADTDSCRLIFGEADFLPGLTVDKFSDVLVVESLALGMDRYKEQIVEDLKVMLAQDGIHIRGVYERSDSREREREGMARLKGFIGEPFDTKVPIKENGIRYLVDVKDGQKTGFFLDQKYNRLAVRRLCKNARVLDCFTHTGSFALNAAAGGAKEVLGVDASETAVAQARENAALNGYVDGADPAAELTAESAAASAAPKVAFQCADVFELLPALQEAGERYDVIILDPPAFTKSRQSVKNAVKGYREINRRAMGLLKDGGYLATCSCSHFVDQELFAETIARAAGDAHVRLRQVEYRTQAPDHPILWGAEDTAYLKFYIFQVTKFTSQIRMDTV